MSLIDMPFACVISISAAVLSGCAAPPKLVIAEPIGPRYIAGRTAGTGRLIVYSAWDRFDILDTDHPKHTAYSIYSTHSNQVIRVLNRSGSFETDPQVVTLPPGTYSIEADATNLGRTKVPAVIRPDATTMIYLDGTTEPANSTSAGNNWVRQPNGMIVGWDDQSNQPQMERASVAK